MAALKSSASAELVIEVSETGRFIFHPRTFFVITAVRDQHHFLAYLVEGLSTKTCTVWLLWLIFEMFVNQSSFGKSADLLINGMIM